jgi:hypothetical protein
MGGMSSQVIWRQPHDAAAESALRRAVATLHLNALIGEQLAAELSKLTSAPSIVFSEYDQATWGYVLFLGGAVSDRFWSVPEIVEEDAAAVRGTHMQRLTDLLGLLALTSLTIPQNNDTALC